MKYIIDVTMCYITPIPDYLTILSRVRSRTIITLHQPVQEEEARKNNADLQRFGCACFGACMPSTKEL